MTISDVHRKYHRLIVGRAMKLARNEHDADDIIQEVYLVIARKLDDLRDHKRIVQWLCKVIFTVGVNWLNRRGRLGRRRILYYANVPDAAVVDDNCDEQRLLIRTQMAALKDEDREVLIRHYFDGLDYARIGCEMGIPKGTVKTRSLRARNRLAYILERRFSYETK